MKKMSLDMFLIPTLVLLLSLCPIPSSSTTLDLSQPSLITWTTNSKTSTLITYNFQFLNTLLCTKLAQFPADYNRTNGKIIISDKNVYVYQPVQVLHQATTSYYYKDYNEIVKQGILTKQISDSQSISKIKTETDKKLVQGNLDENTVGETNLFRILPMVNHASMEFLDKMFFQLDQDTNVYQIPRNKFNLEPSCNNWLSFTKQFLETHPPFCKPASGEKIKQYQFFDKSYLRTSTIGSLNYTLLFENPQIGVSIDIDQSIMGSNLVVKPLAEIVVDLTKVTISVKNFKEGTIQKIKVTVDNKGQSLAFIGLQCNQGSQKLYSQTLLLQPSKYQIFQTQISKSTPTNDILFKVTNPLTKEFYTFSNPSTIVKDTDWVTYSLDGAQFQEISSVSVFIFVGVGVGGFLLIVGIGGRILYKRRQKVREEVKLNLQRQKESVITVSTNSERQFVDRAQIMRIVSPAPVPLPQHPQKNIIIKEKPQQTSTTLDSQNHSNLAQSQQKSQLHVPSLQDKQEVRQQIQIQPLPEPRRFRPAHRRNISTQPMLSQMGMESDIRKSSQIEKLDSVRV